MLPLDFLVEDLPKLFSSMQVGAVRIQTIVQSLRNFSRMDKDSYTLDAFALVTIAVELDFNHARVKNSLFTINSKTSP